MKTCHTMATGLGHQVFFHGNRAWRLKPSYLVTPREVRLQMWIASKFTNTRDQMDKTCFKYPEEQLIGLLEEGCVFLVQSFHYELSSKSIQLLFSFRTCSEVLRRLHHRIFCLRCRSTCCRSSVHINGSSAKQWPTNSDHVFRKIVGVNIWISAPGSIDRQY